MLLHKPKTRANWKHIPFLLYATYRRRQTESLVTQKGPPGRKLNWKQGLSGVKWWVEHEDFRKTLTQNSHEMVMLGRVASSTAKSWGPFVQFSNCVQIILDGESEKKIDQKTLYENHILELRNAELNVKEIIASSGNDIGRTENVSSVFALKTHIHLSFWELHLKVFIARRRPSLPVLATRQYWSTEWTQEYPLITHCSIVRLTWLSVAEIRNNTFSIFGFNSWLFNWLIVTAFSI